MTQELLALAERCERASGPDPELDAEIQVRLFKDPAYKFPAPVLNRKPMNWQEACGRFRWNGGGGSNPWPRYTKSLDAAVTLVPEGSAFVLWSRSIGGKAVADIDAEHVGKATTPALALCAAALRARAHQSEIDQ